MADRIELTVEGMGCQGCVTAVEKAVRSVEASAKVEVRLDTGRVTIDSENASREALVAAISKAGYDIVAG